MMATATTSRTSNNVPGIINIKGKGMSSAASTSPAKQSRRIRQPQPRKGHNDKQVVSAFVDETPQLLPTIVPHASSPSPKKQARRRDRAAVPQGDKGNQRPAGTSDEDLLQQDSSDTQLSQSAPSAPSNLQSRHDSSADEWEMPSNVTAATGDGSGLTWQQQLLHQPQKATRSRQRKKSDHQHQSSADYAEPEQSSSTEQANEAPSGLTWQQKQLQRQSNNRSPVKSSKKQAKKDEETFGLEGLNISNKKPDMGKSKPKTIPNANANANANKSKRTTQTPQYDSGSTTPTKQPAEPRYAGPTFGNSPAPSSLPTPSFMLRRQALEGQT